ncbi:winged helix DNA-binding domain-containing protein [Arthrobacter castelli]|uniref:winged helix DNA-binding domain-containing protein n=1 Tax=Arthrobacter castelli TaxID=271431 RepID=UPI000479AC92|nr:winged helix DNA-binding domain-containing protein [Arthrobacter castelli]
MAQRIDRRRLLQLRLSNQLIEGEGLSEGHRSVADVVSRLLAMQAQDFGQALWAVGLRAPGAIRADVLSALSTGEVIRSWPMRGTLFFVLPSDLRWILALTAERTLASARRRHRELGLDESTLSHARDIALSTLEGQTEVGRKEFMAALEQAGIPTSNQRGYHIIWHLAHTGVVCWGPPYGTQQALVLLDEWVPAGCQPDRDQALREFAVRYFTGHGPASLNDFAWWAKLTLGDARTGLQLARDELTELVHEETSYWVASRSLEEPLPAETDAVHALPGFDEYLIGYQDRVHTLAPEHVPRVIPGKNGIFKPTMVSDARVTGTWRRAKGRADGRGGVTAAAEPFEEMTTEETEAFAHSAKAYEWFMSAGD